MIGRACLALVVLVLSSDMSADLEAARARMDRYRETPNGPLQFAHEQFGIELDPWQQEAMVAFGDPRQQRISLQACAGPGKSTVEAIAGWYFLGCRATHGEHPKGLALSITRENLRDNLWTEFAKWKARSPYLDAAFTWTTNRIFANDHPETWFLATRAWPKTGSAEEQGATLSGLHGKNVLSLIDESGGIPATVLRAAEQSLPNTIFGKILQAGNPISLEGMLYEAANRLRAQWTVLRITGDPDDPKAWVHSPRVATVLEGTQSPADWARQQIAEYTRQNSWVQAYILGQFPPTSLNALLGIEDVEAAMARHLAPDQYDWAQKRLGVDVARFGDDRSVIFPRQGLLAHKPVVLRQARTTDIAARVAMGIAKWKAELTLVDDTGHWGHGVIDNLLAAGIPAIGVQFHGKAINPRYKNRRAEMWITMADAVKGGLALPYIPELIPELTTPTYTFHNGVFLLEEKDQIKKRLGRSPDLADALALTYAIPDMPNEMQTHLAPRAHATTETPDTRGHHATTEYDPYAV